MNNKCCAECDATNYVPIFICKKLINLLKQKVDKNQIEGEVMHYIFGSFTKFCTKFLFQIQKNIDSTTEEIFLLSHCF